MQVTNEYYQTDNNSDNNIYTSNLSLHGGFSQIIQNLRFSNFKRVYVWDSVVAFA